MAEVGEDRPSFSSEAEAAEESAPRALLAGAILGALIALPLAFLALRADLIVAGTLPLAALAAWRAARPPGALPRLQAALCMTAGSSVTAVALVGIAAASAVPAGGSAICALLGGSAVGLAAAALARRMEDRPAEHPEARGAAAALHGSETRRGPLASGAALGALGSVAMSAIAGIPAMLPGIGTAAGSILGLRLSPALLGLGWLMGARTAVAVYAGALLGAAGGDRPWGASLFWGALAGCALAALVDWIRTVARQRRSPAPYRVRFEIGGLGTRVEDLTPRTERGWKAGTAAALLGAVFLTWTLLAPDPDAPWWSAAGQAAGATWIALLCAFAALGFCRHVGVTAAPIAALAYAAATAAMAASTPSSEPTAHPPIGALLGLATCAAALVACVAAQDQAGGRALAATPWRQQAVQLGGVLLGAVLCAWLAGRVLAGPVHDATDPAAFLPVALPAMDRLDGRLVALGAAAFAVLDRLLRGVRALVAGLFLPAPFAATLLAGGVTAWIVNRRAPVTNPDAPAAAGPALAAGLVAGEVAAALPLALIALLLPASALAPRGMPAAIAAGLLFAVLVAACARTALRARSLP